MEFTVTVTLARMYRYEIINEPWAGNIYAKPSLLLPGVAGRDNLLPFYDVIAADIRAEDTDHIIFYEPVTWGMIFNGTLLGPGFDHVPGGKQWANKSVFSFHYYCWWYKSTGDPMEQTTCDRMFIPKVMAEANDVAHNLGGAAMLTEWGQGCSPTRNDTGECDPIMDSADEYLTSWIDWYWQTDLLDHGWNPTAESIKVFSRTFAQSIAGIPSKMSYNADTLRFELCYAVNPTIQQPTVIYANYEVHYTNGVRVSVSGPGAEYLVVSTNSNDNQILVTYTGPTDNSQATDVCVLVLSK